MLEARTISVSIACDWRKLYEAFWRPEDFAKWASGLARSKLVEDGDAWTAQGSDGPVAITFTGHNAFGVMDHRVDIGGGHVVYVPLRVMENGAGAEVALTLFRQPGMSDADFSRDAETVQADLLALKALAER